MSKSEYTPTTGEVRDGYSYNEWDVSSEIEELPRREVFDRWLRKVQSEAWEEGHRCDYIFDEDHVRFCGNPYL